MIVCDKKITQSWYFPIAFLEKSLIPKEFQDFSKDVIFLGNFLVFTQPVFTQGLKKEGNQ
jgi:hypothetical protein